MNQITNEDQALRTLGLEATSHYGEMAARRPSVSMVEIVGPDACNLAMPELATLLRAGFGPAGYDAAALDRRPGQQLLRVIVDAGWVESKAWGQLVDQLLHIYDLRLVGVFGGPAVRLLRMDWPNPTEPESAGNDAEGPTA